MPPESKKPEPKPVEKVDSRVDRLMSRVRKLELDVERISKNIGTGIGYDANAPLEGEGVSEAEAA